MQFLTDTFGRSKVLNPFFYICNNFCIGWGEQQCIPGTMRVHILRSTSPSKSPFFMSSLLASLTVFHIIVAVILVRIFCGRRSLFRVLIIGFLQALITRLLGLDAIIVVVPIAARFGSRLLSSCHWLFCFFLVSSTTGTTTTTTGLHLAPNFWSSFS